MRAGDAGRTVADLLAEVQNDPRIEPIRLDSALAAIAAAAGPRGPAPAVGPTASGLAAAGPAVSGLSAAGPATAAAPATAAGATAVAAAPGGEELILEPYIETARCTTCNECTNLNSKMFAYNENKQAYIKDARAGTFAQLVTAAERCPANLIHPGTPLNPKEKDLAKWIERARPYN
jgi:ferredoxin